MDRRDWAKERATTHCCTHMHFCCCLLRLLRLLSSASAPLMSPFVTKNKAVAPLMSKTASGRHEVVRWPGPNANREKKREETSQEICRNVLIRIFRSASLENRRPQRNFSSRLESLDDVVQNATKSPKKIHPLTSRSCRAEKPAKNGDIHALCAARFQASCLVLLFASGNMDILSRVVSPPWPDSTSR